MSEHIEQRSPRLTPHPPQRHPRNRSLGPDPVRLAGLLARAWLEVRAGHRPVTQLDALLSPAARRRLRHQLPTGTTNRPSGHVRITRLVGSSPAPGVREVAVLVEHEQRLTAIAVRMERHRGSWRATELTAPEAGLRALPTSSIPTSARPHDAFDEVFDEAGESLPDHLRER